MAINSELFVNECFFGPFGWLNSLFGEPDNPLDCWKRRYYPELSVWSLDGTKSLDYIMDFLPWDCNYEGDPIETEVSKGI
jgi:hypothetical protein